MTRSDQSFVTSAPELIVIADESDQLSVATAPSLAPVQSRSRAAARSLNGILANYGARMVPLFGPSEQHVRSALRLEAEVARAPMEDLSVYYRVHADKARLPELREALAASGPVRAAYIKPGVGLPVAPPIRRAGAVPPSSTTPSYEGRQGYLDAAPGGVDARWAWTKAGGTGKGITIIDVEGDWRFTHEDLLLNQGGIIGGKTQTGLEWRNHGTAVLGEFSGDDNGFGVKGIAFGALALGSPHGSGSAAAIRAAAARLAGKPGVILLEMHRPGPRFNYALRTDQRGYIAVEWWPDDFAAVKNAVSSGIVVIEAAGNGAENLDDPLYNTPGPNFPADWTNPFPRTASDSGAIIVGAGAPPSGVFGTDRSRLDFSNYGSCVDCQGWGRGVVTTGYGDIEATQPMSEDLWYTDTFSGTSSASPMITGVAALLQAMALAGGRAPITPAQMRNAFRTTGSPQQASGTAPLGQGIGNRPDLRALVATLSPIAPLASAKAKKPVKAKARVAAKPLVKRATKRPKRAARRAGAKRAKRGP